MNHSETKRLWRENLLPVILGNGAAAHRLSLALYHRYGVTSFLCGRRRTLWDLLNPVTRFLRLYGTEYSSLNTDQLRDFARDAEGCFLLLVSLTEEDRQFLSEEGHPLTQTYILADGQALRGSDPLSFPDKEASP